MPKAKTERGEAEGKGQSGARAILRVPEVLIAIAASRTGCSLTDLSGQVDIPKASLHRLVRTLEAGGYLVHEAASYRIGPNGFHLAALIGQIAPARPLPAVARPELERLAQSTGETVMLGLLSDDQSEIVYADVIDSRHAIRFTIPIGDSRPLYSVAAGKAVLAFWPPAGLQGYIDKTAFTAFTPHTAGKADLPGLMPAIRASAVAFDDSGRVEGASAFASPVFDAAGKVVGAIAVAGPAERMAAARPQIETRVRGAGERVSRALGLDGAYPPTT